MIKTKEDVIRIAHSVLFNISITPFQRDAITSLIEFRAKGVSLDKLKAFIYELREGNEELIIDSMVNDDEYKAYNQALDEIENEFFPSLDSPALKINKRRGVT